MLLSSLKPLLNRERYPLHSYFEGQYMYFRTTTIHFVAMPGTPQHDTALSGSVSGPQSLAGATPSMRLMGIAVMHAPSVFALVKPCTSFVFVLRLGHVFAEPIDSIFHTRTGQGFRWDNLPRSVLNGVQLQRGSTVHRSHRSRDVTLIGKE